MFCRNCGAQLPKGTAVCGNCGKPVKKPGKWNVSALISSVLMIVSVFLPFAQVRVFGTTYWIDLMGRNNFGYSTSGVRDGVFFLAFAGVGILAFLIRKNFILSITGACSVMLALYKINDVSSIKAGMHAGIGGWLVLTAAGFMVMAGASGQNANKR